MVPYSADFEGHAFFLWEARTFLESSLPVADRVQTNIQTYEQIFIPSKALLGILPEERRVTA